MDTAATQVRTAPKMADVHTPLLYDHWYVAGYADEFDEGLHERTFLDRSILLYRTEDGELVALQNRCAHRSFPLIHGMREDDDIRCRYHGAKYDRTGQMVECPSMARCPRVSIKRYATRTSGALAWIWMGDVEPPEGLEPPATPWLLDEGAWAYATGYYELAGNWLLMAENLMDLTHIPFLHQASFNFPKGYAEAKIELEIDGDRLSYYRDNPPGYQRAGFLRPEDSEAIEAAGFQARSRVNFVSPALTYGGARFALERPEPGGLPVYRWEVIHFTTPISAARTHYWYFFSRNYGLGDAALTERIRTMIVGGFEEDRFAIEHVQRMHDQDRHAFREVNFKSDGPAVSMRRIVARMAAREQAARPASA